MKKAKNSLYSYSILHYLICPYCKKDVEISNTGSDTEMCIKCDKEIDISQINFKDD